MIIIGCNAQSFYLKHELIEYLEKLKFDYLDVSGFGDEDIYDTSMKVVNEVLKDRKNHKGIIIDEYGSIPFMIAAKHKYIICAQLNDSHSAKMTRDHNNTNIITLGSKVLGSDIAKEIVKRFVYGEYAAGRHQIRVDMLDRMCSL